MKKLRNFLIGLILFFLIASFLVVQYLNSGSLEPDNTVWESYIGRDTTVGILPDAYANYFTYTLARTNNNTGFKISANPVQHIYAFIHLHTIESIENHINLTAICCSIKFPIIYFALQYINE